MPHLSKSSNSSNVESRGGSPEPQLWDFQPLEGVTVPKEQDFQPPVHVTVPKEHVAKTHAQKALKAGCMCVGGRGTGSFSGFTRIFWPHPSDHTDGIF